MADIRAKVSVTENPNCWFCRNGKVTSSADSFTEFVDTATVSCKLGLKPGCLDCHKAYEEKTRKI